MPRKNRCAFCVRQCRDDDESESGQQHGSIGVDVDVMESAVDLTLGKEDDAIGLVGKVGGRSSSFLCKCIHGGLQIRIHLLSAEQATGQRDRSWCRFVKALLTQADQSFIPQGAQTARERRAGNIVKFAAQFIKATRLACAGMEDGKMTVELGHARSGNNFATRQAVSSIG